MLIGVNEENLEVLGEKKLTFCHSVSLVRKDDGKNFEMINVYGPVQENKKADFLLELEGLVEGEQKAIMMGGDFNLVRSRQEKSTENVNERWVAKFNEFIAEAELREIHRIGGRFTWSNKQNVPIRVVLDKILVSRDFEGMFPLLLVQVITRLGSDHSALLVDSGDSEVVRSKIFRFEPAWLLQEGFREWLQGKWPKRVKRNILDHWHDTSYILRRSLKGWGANVGGDVQKKKQAILMNIKDIDDASDQHDISIERWDERHKLEAELMTIYQQEELFWQKRGGEKWLLEGDANTRFFHRIANGRKRKCTIKSLEDGGEIISKTEQLKKLITDYYKQLFGSTEPTNIHLQDDIWSEQGGVSEEDNQNLIREFTMTELEQAVKEMKSDSAPGPDGFSTLFFKEFWDLCKADILEMLQNLHRDNLNLARLNFGIITLIPKVRGATNIKQFRPICLLNVIYKIITKVLTVRLTRVVAKVIGESQTAFIAGRFILDGVVILHEILHELGRRKQKGVILKLDFEKAYDKVRWSFVQVLEKKNFDVKWIRCIMAAVTGGRVAVNLNGEVGDKSEIFGMGLEDHEQLEIAHILNCKVGILPMKYLGIPVSNTKLTKKDLNMVAEKIENRLATWKCG
ncbi:hypothetical protein C2845_PM01G41450 [Panicum miliaceum]|uniref:Reverse transcriptase domain-containing protein n=1 Tax=Panicum miliaceum TaxID=4540 RepID=A0A3L6TK45_PANMI|nr:hypothetical protein C2845_PM01G41450 [Panicum miliaceum]